MAIDGESHPHRDPSWGTPPADCNSVSGVDDVYRARSDVAMQSIRGFSHALPSPLIPGPAAPRPRPPPHRLCRQLVRRRQPTPPPNPVVDRGRRGGRRPCCPPSRQSAASSSSAPTPPTRPTSTRTPTATRSAGTSTWSTRWPPSSASRPSTRCRASTTIIPADHRRQVRPRPLVVHRHRRAREAGRLRQLLHAPASSGRPRPARTSTPTTPAG